MYFPFLQHYLREKLYLLRVAVSCIVSADLLFYYRLFLKAFKRIHYE